MQARLLCKPRHPRCRVTAARVITVCGLRASAHTLPPACGALRSPHPLTTGPFPQLGPSRWRRGGAGVQLSPPSGNSARPPYLLGPLKQTAVLHSRAQSTAQMSLSHGSLSTAPCLPGSSRGPQKCSLIGWTVFPQEGQDTLGPTSSAPRYRPQ